MELGKDFEVVQTERGKRKILHGGYSYIKKKNLAEEKELFECTQRRSTPTCYATLSFKVILFKSKYLIFVVLHINK